MIQITLPFPPSSNRYWRHNRGRIHRSKEADDYCEQVSLICRVEGITPLEGDVSLRMLFFRPAKRGDLDNLLKVLGDALQGYAYANDKQIAHIDAKRSDADRKNPRVEITLTEVGE